MSNANNGHLTVINLADEYRKLRNVTDPALIERILTCNNSVARAYLVKSLHLSAEQLERLSKDPEANVRFEVAQRESLPEEIMKSLAVDPVAEVRIELSQREQLSEDILKVLRKDTNEKVRMYAFCNLGTELSEFKSYILNLKLTSDTRFILLYNNRIASSVEVFESLWIKEKTNRDNLINSLHYAYSWNFSEIDPECARFVHDEIRSGNVTNRMKEMYARADTFSLPEILDSLKDDKHRPVINAIAGNKSAWVSTHRYLAHKHKTSSIRIDISRVTTDNNLLNDIYHGTKSKDIREAVEKNPLFVNLKP